MQTTKNTAEIKTQVMGKIMIVFLCYWKVCEKQANICIPDVTG
jgi:hypothetical protein